MGKKKITRFDVNQLDDPSYEELSAYVLLLEEQVINHKMAFNEDVILVMNCIVKRIIKSLCDEVDIEIQNCERKICVWTTPDGTPGIYITMEVLEGSAIRQRIEKHLAIINNENRFYEFVRAMNRILGRDNSSYSSTSLIPVGLMWRLDD